MPLPARARHRDASRARVRLPATVVLSAEGEDRQEGVREGQRACSSQARQLHGEVEGTPARARECPCVTRVYTEDNAACGFAGISAKPSDGLEPSTPSLPSRFLRGKRGQGREVAGTKDPLNDANQPKMSDRAWTRVPGLAFPQCSLTAVPNLAAIGASERASSVPGAGRSSRKFRRSRKQCGPNFRK